MLWRLVQGVPDNGERQTGRVALSSKKAAQPPHLNVAIQPVQARESGSDQGLSLSPLLVWPDLGDGRLGHLLRHTLLTQFVPQTAHGNSRPLSLGPNQHVGVCLIIDQSDLGHAIQNVGDDLRRAFAVPHLVAQLLP